MARKGNPIIGAISSFYRPNEVHGIVKDIYTNWSMLIETHDVYFFGYKSQCEKNLKNYPDSIIVDRLEEKLIEKNDN